MATAKQLKYWESLKGKKLKAETCKKMSNSKKGKTPNHKFPKGHGKISSGNWKGGISRGYAYKLVKKLCCQDCGNVDCKLTIHHIDKNPKNNEISNLRVLCYKCHIGKIHNAERRLIKQKDRYS